MPVKPLNILLVDDDKKEESNFKEALSSLELTFNLYYSSGKDTIYDLLQLKPDMIFLDINMPQGCGHKLLENIKSNPQYKHIPVIMYSISQKTDDIENSYKHGAHYYFIKPYAQSNFAQSLKKLFKIDWTQPQPVPTLENFIINLTYA
jgi:CheY-like chemotaxis protein